MKSNCPKCGAAWRHRLHEPEMEGTIDYWQCDSYRRNIYGDNIIQSHRCLIAALADEVERLRKGIAELAQYADQMPGGQHRVAFETLIQKLAKPEGAK